MPQASLTRIVRNWGFALRGGWQTFWENYLRMPCSRPDSETRKRAPYITATSTTTVAVLAFRTTTATTTTTITTTTATTKMATTNIMTTTTSSHGSRPAQLCLGSAYLGRHAETCSLYFSRLSVSIGGLWCECCCRSCCCLLLCP